MSLLEVTDLNSYYGDSHILFDVSLRVDKNEVVALIGRNGAGKSTTLKSLMGVVKPRAGSIRLLRVVDLPAPLRPRRATTSFFSTRSATSASAGMRP